MKPAVHEQRRALSGHLDPLLGNGNGKVPLAEIIGALERGSPIAKHAADRIAAYFAADGFDRAVTSSELTNALLSTVEAADRTTAIDLKANAELEPYLRGEVPIDEQAYTKITGVAVSRAQAGRLDAVVKDVAASIGLDHAVSYASEVKFRGKFYPYAVLGTFEIWDQPTQPIKVGIGVKAQTVDDLELLYRSSVGVPAALKPMLEDFLQLSERDRIEAVLVHEALELDAVRLGFSDPHRSAVHNAPRTDLKISARTRKHLELYRTIDQRTFGALK